MSIYSKDKIIMKTIRINQTEKDNWDINKIHAFLQGKSLNTTGDVELLKKMIVAFIKNRIEIDLEENEIERVKELHAKI